MTFDRAKSASRVQCIVFSPSLQPVWCFPARRSSVRRVHLYWDGQQWRQQQDGRNPVQRGAPARQRLSGLPAPEVEALPCDRPSCCVFCLYLRASDPSAQRVGRLQHPTTPHMRQDFTWMTKMPIVANRCSSSLAACSPGPGHVYLHHRRPVNVMRPARLLEHFARVVCAHSVMPPYMHTEHAPFASIGTLGKAVSSQCTISPDEQRSQQPQR